jgi:hypothetical protein
MRVELDHLFVCANVGAPEAEELIQFGLCEGLPNQHPGQGSACRRFPFLNAMIELFWVSDATEARNQSTRRTQLWERWTERRSGACPFGICVRPADSEDAGSETNEPPFPAWTYRPAYLTDPLVMHIGEAAITEPMWVYMGFMRRAHREAQFVEHPVGVRSITRLTLTGPRPLRSAASQKIVEDGILSTREGETSFLEIEFDNNQRKQTKDFRPHLPIILKI